MTLIGFDIVEILQTLGFALLFGPDDNYHWKLQLYIFVFVFRGIFSEISYSESLAEVEVNVVGDKSASAIFIFRFPMSCVKGKIGSFPYKAH